MRVVGYVRVSTSEQAEEDYSLGTQRAALQAECERRGWDLVDVIKDSGYSGRTDDRPGLNKVLAMLSVPALDSRPPLTRRNRLRSVVSLGTRAGLRTGSGEGLAG